MNTRADWIAALVRRKARILGTDPFGPVHVALTAYEQGDCAARAVRRGVAFAAERADSQRG